MQLCRTTFLTHTDGGGGGGYLQHFRYL